MTGTNIVNRDSIIFSVFNCSSGVAPSKSNDINTPDLVIYKVFVPSGKYEVDSFFDSFVDFSFNFLVDSFADFSFNFLVGSFADSFDSLPVRSTPDVSPMCGLICSPMRGLICSPMCSPIVSHIARSIFYIFHVFIFKSLISLRIRSGSI